MELLVIFNVSVVAFLLIINMVLRRSNKILRETFYTYKEEVGNYGERYKQLSDDKTLQIAQLKDKVRNLESIINNKLSEDKKYEIELHDSDELGSFYLVTTKE